MSISYRVASLLKIWYLRVEVLIKWCLKLSKYDLFSEKRWFYFQVQEYESKIETLETEVHNQKKEIEELKATIGNISGYSYSIYEYLICHCFLNLALPQA